MSLVQSLALPRYELPARLLEELHRTGAILLSGPSSSGKTHTLRELARLLGASDRPHFFLDHDDPNAALTIREAEPNQVYLIDRLEAVRFDVVEALVERDADGVSGVAAISSDVDSQEYEEVLQRVAAECPEAAEFLTRVRSFRIAPLTLDEGRRIANGEQFRSFDSVTVDAAIELSLGRPGWLLDILQLASTGKVRADPRPSISELDAGELHLPLVRQVVERAERQLNDEDRAAAITLSWLEPRTIDGASDLVGSAQVSNLLRAKILIESPDDRHRYHVPQIYAAVLRVQAPGQETRRMKHLVASRLLAQEALGIPLPEREAEFCAWKFEDRLTADNDRAPHLTAAHSRVLKSFAADLVMFARPGARELLLRLNSPEPLGELARARSATVIMGPLDAIQTLDGPAHGTSSGTSDGADDLLAYDREFLRSQLAAEVDSARLDVPCPGLSEDVQRAALLFDAWNTRADRPLDTVSLRRLCTEHPQPEVALLAEQLLMLEIARTGRTPAATPDPSAASAERLERIASLALSRRIELRDLVSTATIAEAVIAMLSGFYLDTFEPMRRVVQRLSAHAYHRLWLSHYQAAITALVMGDLSRAAQEWAYFNRRLPRFIPVRLRGLIERAGTELQHPGLTRVDERKPAHELLAYLRGSLDTVQLDRILSPAPSGPEPATSPLPVFQLAKAHLDALEAQNPAALIRVADQLRAQGHWAPAVFALQAARSIFVRRRASGSVARCDLALIEVERDAQRLAPWFELASLPSAQHHRMTKRELDAAYLATAGLSNRAIAERLACGVRTVESHLASARAKLGASNRHDLAHRMRELGYA